MERKSAQLDIRFATLQKIMYDEEFRAAVALIQAGGDYTEIVATFANVRERLEISPEELDTAIRRASVVDAFGNAKE